MSYDLHVYAPDDGVEITAAQFTDNMEAIGWQIRLLNHDDGIVSDFSEAACILAWDIGYEPAPVFDQRYVPGVHVDFNAIAEDEECFLCCIGIDVDVIPVSEWDHEERAEELGEENYRRFMSSLSDNGIRSYSLHTGGSSHPYRFLLQFDVTTLIAYMTDGVLYDPQKGMSNIFDDEYPIPDDSPLERAQKHIARMSALSDDEYCKLIVDSIPKG